jgi:hypothetical protein
MEISKRPFQIKITAVDEIRMGSPFNHCHIELVGSDKIKLSEAGWQDKYAWTSDSKRLVLIKWDFATNDPAFHLFLIDTETGKTKESGMFYGLPKSISIIGDKIKLTKFIYSKEKSGPDNLCCDIEEEYEFTW